MRAHILRLRVRDPWDFLLFPIRKTTRFIIFEVCAYKTGSQVNSVIVVGDESAGDG